MKRNILLIIPNLGKGGAQQVFRQQFQYLSLTHNVFGCVFNWNGAFIEDKLENIISLDVPGGKDYYQKIFFFIKRTTRLRRLKKKHQIEISISHLEGADYINILSRRIDKTICWIHGTKFHDKNIRGLLGFLRKRVFIPKLYNRTNMLVTVSKGIETELVGNIKGIEQIVTTIYNGFDINRIVQLSSEPLDDNLKTLFSESQTIITHCRLSRQKNIDSLLLLFSRLRNRNDVKLVVLGDGELREELLVYVTQLGLNYFSCWDEESIDFSKDVYFLGQQQNPFKFLSKASFYVMTSLWEGFPLALCEALVCGLPVIAPDCFTGPREILAPGLELPQPITIPFRCSYGFLMPLPEQTNSEEMNHWVLIMERMVRKEFSFQSNLGVERINEFSILNSMNQTDLLIERISDFTSIHPSNYTNRT